MKCMNRNKVKFFYALYEKKESIKDDYGNDTGEYEVIYSNPVEYFANISTAKGETQTRQFGENESYDRVIVFDNDAPPIDAYSILWIDITPQINEDGTLAVDKNGKIITPHDYIVKEAGSGLNSKLIAISKVKVS